MGLEHMVGLYRLELPDNEIVDVGPLASLTNLVELRLDENRIVDVSPLASLTGSSQRPDHQRTDSRPQSTGCQSPLLTRPSAVQEHDDV